VSRFTVTLGESYGFPAAAVIPSVSSDAIPNSKSLEDLAEDSSFAVEGPALLPPGCLYVEGRPYHITVGKKSQPALKIVYQYEKQDQYLGIM
jgi:hypothetical protein